MALNNRKINRATVLKMLQHCESNPVRNAFDVGKLKFTEYSQKSGQSTINMKEEFQSIPLYLINVINTMESDQDKYDLSPVQFKQQFLSAIDTSFKKIPISGILDGMFKNDVLKRINESIDSQELINQLANNQQELKSLYDSQQISVSQGIDHILGEEKREALEDEYNTDDEYVNFQSNFEALKELDNSYAGYDEGKSDEDFVAVGSDEEGLDFQIESDNKNPPSIFADNGQANQSVSNRIISDFVRLNDL